MILRVFWPCSLASDQGTLDHEAPCLLLGALLSSTQKLQPVLSAVVVAAVAITQLPPVEAVEQQLANSRVSLPTGTVQGTLALLGVWQPGPQHEAASAGNQRASADDLWLVLHSKETVGSSSGWQAQQLQAPVLNLQQSTPPSGTQTVQMFLYSVPAQQPGCVHVQLPLPPPAPQLPWMSREPGAVSLSSVMHMLQDAHAAVQAAQLQQQQPSSQQQMPTEHVAQQQQQQQQARTRLQQQQQQQQARTRLQRQRAQQQQPQQPAHSAAHSTGGWAQLADVVTAAHNNVRTGWLAQHVASLTHRSQEVKQLFLHLMPAAFAAQRPTETAAQGAAGAHQATAAAGSHAQPLPGSQPDFLQWFVQHLLGVLIALNLLLHRQLVLDAGAAGGAWLQHDVLQPHIDWLTQAHPGGVKLHLELSLLLGTAAEAFLQATSAVYTLSAPILGPAALTVQAAAAAVGGASWGCAAAADVLLVLLAPLVLLYVLAACLHRLQLWCLAATWRLIRGKQKVRRFSTHHRTAAQQQPSAPSASTGASKQGTLAGQAGPTAATPAAAAGSATPAVPGAGGNAAAGTPIAVGSEDSTEPGDEVSVEQLIVGVLLFTPLLGLFPTSVAWYISVCGLYGVLHVLRLLLVAVGSWMQLRPLHVLAARWKSPQLFPGQLMVLPLTPDSTTRTAVRTAFSTAAAAQADVNRYVLTDDDTAAGSSRGGSRQDVGRGNRHGTQQHVQRGSKDVQVAHYRIFYEPLGYWDVLVHSIAQQQGLLWYVCQGVHSSSSSGERGSTRADSIGGGVWLLRWVKDVAAGRVWGLRMLSTKWRGLL